MCRDCGKKEVLNKLATKYGADKWGKHHYTPIYYDLFKDRRLEVKKVLEIGIAEGASLFMWRDFFPNATIYGADNDQKRVYDLDVYEHITPILCDQADPIALGLLMRQLGTQFDLVIDDGSHVSDDQVFTCAAFMPVLPKDAIYVIEDVAKPEIVDRVAFLLGDKYDIELKRVGDRYDDQLVIVRHKK